MSTPPSSASQPPSPEQSPSSEQPAEPSTAEKTVFFKPCFGITVKSSTLCVSVSAKPDSTPPGPPACG